MGISESLFGLLSLNLLLILMPFLQLYLALLAKIYLISHLSLWEIFTKSRHFSQRKIKVLTQTNKSVSLAIANNESKKLARLLVHMNLKS
jgi:hypothetical protein